MLKGNAPHVGTNPGANEILQWGEAPEPHKMQEMGTIWCGNLGNGGFAGLLWLLEERQVLSLICSVWAKRRVKIYNILLLGTQENSARLFLTALAQELNLIKALALGNTQLQCSEDL